MSQETETIGFQLSISGRDDGTLEAVYISLSDAPVARTQEVRKDILLVDYDDAGKVVGVEILAPIRLSELDEFVEPPKRAMFRTFVKRRAPAELVTA